MNNQYGLTEGQYAQLLSAIQQFPAIESAFIFGSWAKGTPPSPVTQVPETSNNRLAY